MASAKAGAANVPTTGMAPIVAILPYDKGISSVVKAGKKTWSKLFSGKLITVEDKNIDNLSPPILLIKGLSYSPSSPSSTSNNSANFF